MYWCTGSRQASVTRMVQHASKKIFKASSGIGPLVATVHGWYMGGTIRYIEQYYY